MNRSSIVFLGTSISAFALLLAGAGCSSSSSTGTGTGGGTGGGATTGTTTTTSATTGTGTGTGTGGSGPATLDCASYCAEVMTNCTETHAQYADMDGCMGSCKGFTAGTLSDMSGNTLGCRIYHAGAPAATDPALHCPHAGPTGGDKDPKGTSGTCGEACDAFCDIALKNCTQQYKDKPTCMTDCQMFKADTGDFSTADTGTNDMGCRFYHLTVASSSATNAMMHCPHIVSMSPVCTM